MLKHRKYRKEMKVLAEELERACNAFDRIAYYEVIGKIRKVNSDLYRSYGRFRPDIAQWIILLLLLVLAYVVSLIWPMLFI